RGCQLLLFTGQRVVAVTSPPADSQPRLAGRPLAACCQRKNTLFSLGASSQSAEVREEASDLLTAYWSRALARGSGVPLSRGVAASGRTFPRAPLAQPRERPLRRHPPPGVQLALGERAHLPFNPTSTPL